ncbi:hypothetical protein BC835DRAFT_694557 [Cytidiella melzeri]|nr:hypothetical protein BC835DRAFT_694557 [Cytidiella melzeri]
MRLAMLAVRRAVQSSRFTGMLRLTAVEESQRSHIPGQPTTTFASMSRSVASFHPHESVTTLTSNTNDSTAALIPKSSKSSDAKSIATCSTSTTTYTTGSTKTNPPQPAKDWEKAYAQLATSIGFAGGVPQLPKKKTKTGDSGRKGEKTAAFPAGKPSEAVVCRSSWLLVRILYSPPWSLHNTANARNSLGHIC